MKVNSISLKLVYLMLILTAGFLLVGYLVTKPAVLLVDQQLSEMIYNLSGHRVIDQFFLIVTDLGSSKLAFPLLALLAAYFLYKRQFYFVFLLFFNVVGVRSLNWVLKTIYARERPLVEHLADAGYYSFPSGHSMHTMAFFGFIAYMLWVYGRGFGRPAIHLYVLWIFVFIILVGFSRVYLGVHFVFDVIGGFFAGAAWSVLCIILLRFGRR